MCLLWVHICMHVNMWKRASVYISMEPHSYYLVFSSMTYWVGNQKIFLNLGFAVSGSLASQLARRTACPSLKNWDYILATTHTWRFYLFYLSFADLNSVPHICTANTLLTDPSHSSFNMYFYSCIFHNYI